MQLGAFITYALTGNKIDPAIIFSALQYFQQLQQPLTQIPMAFNTLVQRQTSLNRIGGFLKQEDMKLDEGDVMTTEPPEAGAPQIFIRNGEFSWTMELRDAALKHGNDLAARAKYMTEYRKKQAEIREKEAARGGKKKKKETKVVANPALDPNTPAAKSTDVETGDAVSVLTNVNFEIKTGELIAIVGPVGE